MFNRRKQLIQGLVVLCELKQQFDIGTKNKNLTKIYFLLKICLRFYIFFQIFFMLSVFYFNSRDFSVGYGKYLSLTLILRFGILSIFALIATFLVTSWAIFWVQLYIVVSIFNRIKLEKLKKDFSFLMKIPKGFL